MFLDIWQVRLSEAERAQKSLETQIKDIDKQTQNLLDRIVDAGSESVIKAYEARIDKLEREKIKFRDRAEKSVPTRRDLTEVIEPAVKFLSNPWNLYQKGSFAVRQTVLRLAFAEPLTYYRNEGYRTAKTTFPFKVLADFSTQKCGMVGDPGIEPGVRLREGVTVPCHTLRPVAHDQWLCHLT